MGNGPGSSGGTSPDSARAEIRSRAVELIGRTPSTLLRAPAGFGKSTAMRAHRAAATGRRTAWVSFATVRPSEIDRVAGLLVDAIGALAAGPVTASRLRSAAPTRGHALGPRFASALGDVLLGLDHPWRLYLDDLHRLPATAAEELGELLERLAEADRRSGCRVVVATRTTPPWPVERWQLAGWLTVIGPDELRLDEAEARVVLGAHHAEHAGEVLATTTGWPAAVATAGALFDVSRAGGRPAEVGVVAEALDAYIRDEVLADLDPTDLNLLTHLVVVGGAAPTALAVASGRADAVVRLRRLADETALVVEHADERFELHPLLARVLSERLGHPGR